MKTIIIAMAGSRSRTASRQADLVARLNQAGFMSVGDLADTAGVSEITVRRDLAELERTGAVRRTHGGALGLRRGDASAFDAEEPSFEARRRRNGAAKTRIARTAERLIEPGMSIAIDTGTTTLELARLVAIRTRIKAAHTQPLSEEQLAMAAAQAAERQFMDFTQEVLR